MGWANCGTDGKGRRIGYAVSARCDHAGCKAKIHRGLSYACGGMHGTSDGCELYCCGAHLRYHFDPADGQLKPFCFACAEHMEAEERREFVTALHEILAAASLDEAKEVAGGVLIRWDEYRTLADLPPGDAGIRTQSGGDAGGSEGTDPE